MNRRRRNDEGAPAVAWLVPPRRPVVCTSVGGEWTIFAGGSRTPSHPAHDTVTLIWRQFFVVHAEAHVLVLEAFDDDSLQTLVLYHDFEVSPQRLLELTDLLRLKPCGVAPSVSLQVWSALQHEAPREHVETSLRTLQALYGLAPSRLETPNDYEAYMAEQALTLVVAYT